MMQQVPLYLTILLVPLLVLPWPVQFLLAALVGLFFALRNRKSDPKQVSAFFGGFRFGGHRGSPLHAPENTLASFEKARDEGADLVEFDIGLTRDAVAVLMHDDSLDRTTNMRGALRAQTLEELRAAGCDCAANFKLPGNLLPRNGDAHKPLTHEPDAGVEQMNPDEKTVEQAMFPEDKFGNPVTEPTERSNSNGLASRLPQAPICTLEDAVRWAKSRGVKMIFDVKDTDSTLVDQIDAIFEQYALYDSACVCSFFPAVVYRVKRRNARILTGLTWRRWFISYADLAWTKPRFAHPFVHRVAVALDVLLMVLVKLAVLPQFLGADMVLTERGEISENSVKYMHSRGLHVCAWTVNDEREMAWMAHKLGMPFLTDLPHKAHPLLTMAKKDPVTDSESAFELN